MGIQIIERDLGNGRRVVAEIEQHLPPPNPDVVERIVWTVSKYMPGRTVTLCEPMAGGLEGPAVLDGDGKPVRIELGPTESLGRVRELPSLPTLP